MREKWILALTVVALFIIPACGNGTKDQVTFRGTVMTGAQLGEVKNHCAEGLYLVAENGYLVEQTRMLLLRIPDENGEAVMLADPQYIGKHVEVSGKYPAQEVFCDALICECEDYILATEINVVSP